ncbi:MAG TPA: ATP-dependent helicase, partial [Dermatophilaceae bacterium]|nr:ATP-dependent helicase [Dermatophilaceae bacterium]
MSTPPPEQPPRARRRRPRRKPATRHTDGSGEPRQIQPTREARPTRGPRESREARAERYARRRESVPTITYPDDLPIAARRDDIAAAIRDHQVVVVAGETGSGKTTQLPKILLELGRGIHGMIGHTQPRRIAARAVGERLAEELGVELGGVVGYQVR